MHRIARDTDLSPLHGKVVENISLGRFQVIINLQNDLFISIEGECMFAENPSAGRSEDYVSLANNFARLLGTVIERAAVISDEEVQFVFSNGMHLSLFDSKEQFESFQIQLPGKLIVV